MDQPTNLTKCFIHDCHQHGLCLRGDTRLSLRQCRFVNNNIRALYGYAATCMNVHECIFEGTKSEKHAAVEIKIAKNSKNSATAISNSNSK